MSRLSGGYQGDYIGIASANNKAFPVWMDNRNGNYQAWIAEIQFGLTIIQSPFQNTENLSGPYEIKATIASQNNLDQSEVKIFWGRETGNITDSLLMSNKEGGLYTANIPGDGLPHIYNYFIKATDNLGLIRIAPAGAPAKYFSFEAVHDFTPPDITHNISDQIKPKWPVSVSADVVDNIGTRNVECDDPPHQRY